MTKLNGPLRIGIGGPVGAGKTTLTARLSERLKERYSIGVITNDIYTEEDAEALTRMQILPSDRIIGVQTGGCPHTAIREDASVIDVAAGEEIPRKGGPAVTRSDILVINKVDLAPYVGASLAVMETDATRVRAGRPFQFTNLKLGEGVDDVLALIHRLSGLA